ncbi:MAG: hypothetical protein ACOCXJ_06540 [Planctomycetota bacterium]
MPDTLEVADPTGLPNDHLRALWYLAHDDWDESHRLCQIGEDSLSCWIHAHLHRVEGDLGNAGYWYRRAGMAPRTDELPTEFADLVRTAG